MTIEAGEVARIMGGQKVLRRRVESLADLQELISTGLPIRALNETVRYVAGNAPIAASLKDRLVPRATRARRTRLKTSESERVERLARLMAMAEHIWEIEEDARAFMREPHQMLGGETPIEMAETELGGRRVEELLAALEYNLPA